MFINIIIFAHLELSNEPTVVTASSTTYNKLAVQGPGVDPKADLRLSNGATLLLETSWATHSNVQNDYGIILYGSTGGAKIHVQNYNTENTLMIFKDIAGVLTEIRPQAQGGGFHNAVMSSFIDKIVSRNWSLYNGSEGLRRVRIIDACYTSASQGREVMLDDS